MGDPRLPRTIYALLLFAGFVIGAYYYPQMPQRMASHFAADGFPNGWQPRDTFFLIMILVTATSAIVTFFAPRQISSQPDARINLPNKSYWLAPEHRAQTMQFFAAVMAWFGCAIALVLIFGTWLAFRANLSADHRFDSQAMLVVLAGFLLSIGGLLLWVMRHFRRIAPPA